MSIRVLLADDQALVRAGLAMVIDSQPDMRVVGQAVDGADAVQQLRATRADVVLMDIRMQRMDGVEATRRLTAAAGDGLRIVALTTWDLDEHAFAALRAGASGFLLKDTAPEDMLAAIRAVHRGDAVIAPSTTRRLLDHVAAELPGGSTGDDPLRALTEREREVLMLLARGLSNSEIGKALFLSEATIKTHVGRILAKLELRDRIQIVVLAYERGLIRPGR